MAKYPIHPKHPERVCWGCAHYCPADRMGCGNGSERTPHPVETFGEDWFECLQDEKPSDPPSGSS